MTQKTRLEKLEKSTGAQLDQVDVIEIRKTYSNKPDEIEMIDLRTAKPSKILAEADRLVSEGVEPTTEQKSSMESIRLAVKNRDDE